MNIPSPRRLIVLLLAALGVPGCGEPFGFMKSEPRVEDLAGVWVLDPASLPGLNGRGCTPKPTAQIDLKSDGSFVITDIPNFDQLSGSPLSTPGTWTIQHWKSGDARWCVKINVPSGFGRMLGYSFPLYIVGKSKPSALIFPLDADGEDVVRYIRK